MAASSACILAAACLSSLSSLLLLLLVSPASACGTQPNPSRLLPGFSFARGASNQYADSGSIVMNSPGGTFLLSMTSCRLVIVHNDTGVMDTVVWETDFPDCGDALKHTLLFRADGNLVVVTATASGTIESWSTDTSGRGVQSIELLDTGNLVLLDAQNVPIWQSFDHPSSVLLSGQRLQQGMNLSITDYLSALTYSLVVEPSRLVLYVIDAEAKAPYWQLLPTSPQDKVAYAALDRGIVQLYDANSHPLTNQTISNTSASYTLWRAELGASAVTPEGIKNGGNLRIYYWSMIDGAWHLQSQAITNLCSFPDACEPYATCNPSTQQCSCSSPLVHTNAGCDLPRSSKRGLEDNFCSSNSRIPKKLRFFKLENTSYFPLSNGASGYNSTYSDCKSYCLQNCSCSAFVYQDGLRSCYPIHESSDRSTMTFVTVNDSQTAVYVRTSSGVSGAITFSALALTSYLVLSVLYLSI